MLSKGITTTQAGYFD